MMLQSIYDFVATNGLEILTALLATQALAQVIVNLTPTPTDNMIVGKIYRAIEWLAGIWTERAKQKPPEPAAETRKDGTPDPQA